MKHVVAIFADLAETFLGHPSLLDQPVAGRTLLDRTLRRAVAIDPEIEVALIVRPRDQAAAQQAVKSAGLAERIRVLPVDDGARPRRGLIRSARKWNLDGWRGSPLGLTWFDEFIEPRAVALALDALQADALLCLDAYQPLLDADIARRMIAHHRSNADEAPYVFTHAPPGLAGVIISRSAAAELLAQNCPLGLWLSYRPETPRMDPITKPPCLLLPGDITSTAARFRGDTPLSLDLVRRAMEALGIAPDAAALCAWQRSNRLRPALPPEVELELTTDDPLPETRLRPRGSRSARRGPVPLDAVQSLARQIAMQPESALVLGGHGDPLAHPGFAGICRAIREEGVTTLGVTTPLVHLDDKSLEALIGCQVDAVEILLDADSAETYRTVQKSDRFARVNENIGRLQEARRARTSPQPLIICGITRCGATLDEIESFVDRWTREAGWAVIRGSNDYCGALPRDPLPTLTPPRRTPCRRLDRGLVLLADGSATACMQDVRGVAPIGRWIGASLRELWESVELAGLRDRHASGGWHQDVLCGGCQEWFRP